MKKLLLGASLLVLLALLALQIHNDADFVRSHLVFISDQQLDRQRELHELQTILYVQRG